MFEIRILDEWVGRSISELNFRNRYNLNIIGLKKENEIQPIINPNFTMPEDEHLMVVGKMEDVKKVIRK